MISAQGSSPVIACTVVHCHVAARQPLQDALSCIREGTSLGQAGYLLLPNAERRLKSPEEMRALFADWPEALENTLLAAGRCHFSLGELRYRYPSEWIPQGSTAQGHLEKLAWEGARRRGQGTLSPKLAFQLRHELALIAKLDFADYFLSIHELVDFARSQRILAQGRGSAANSVLCYCLGITSVDPSQIDLLFERFLSLERAEPPDIDVDFEHERREEVLQHLYDKYGRHRAAMVSAVIKYRSRSAIAEISKALGRPARVGRALRDVAWEGFEPQVQRLGEGDPGFPAPPLHPLGRLRAFRHALD